MKKIIRNGLSLIGVYALIVLMVIVASNRVEMLDSSSEADMYSESQVALLNS